MKDNISELELQMQEMQDLRSQIEVLNNKLQENEKFKTHFLSNIRNALVNPFSSVISLSGEIIKSDVQNWKRVIKLAALIHSEAFDLDFQLKNIFSTAELESGEKHPEICKTDVKEIVDSCIDSLKYVLRKKNIELKTTANYRKQHFNTDPAIITSILRNLLHNAIKYSVSPGLVEVTISVGEYLQIIVKDHGIGISQGELELVFDRFYRSDPEINSENIGHGLGLSIVKNLTELIGGTINTTSQIGQGSEFIVIIPKKEFSATASRIELDEASAETYLF